MSIAVHAIRREIIFNTSSKQTGTQNKKGSDKEQNGIQCLVLTSHVL